MTPTAGHRRKANDRYDHESICRHPGVWFTINSPGAEIETALVGRILNVPTPFGVEFGRSSIKRNGAPTLVPVQDGGSPVLAQILLVNISEEEAKGRPKRTLRPAREPRP